MEGVCGAPLLLQVSLGPGASHLLRDVLVSPVPSLRPQADVPRGNPQEDVVSRVQVPLQRPDSDSEPQSQCSDLQTSATFPTMQQQEELAEPEPGRRYGSYRSASVYWFCHWFCPVLVDLLVPVMLVLWWYQYLSHQSAPAGGTGNIQWSSCSEV